MHCKKKGLYKRDCPDFLKSLLRRSKDEITFVDESLYLDYSVNTWWIDSGATVHVANSLQGFRSTRTTLRSERHVKVANGVQAEVEAIGDVFLELVNGFMLVLRDVFFVPSLQRNLISVSRLDKYGYGCHFENDKCELWYDNNCVGDAFLHNELYLLSMHDKVHSVYDANVNVIASLSVNANRKRKRTQVESSKLWHCRLGHISRGEN